MSICLAKCWIGPRGRKVNNLKVNYIHSDILEHVDRNYSIIITNFFFDQFNQPVAKDLLLHIISLLDKDGHLLFADFTRPFRLKERLLFWTMYRFFRITSKIDNVQLANYQALFERSGLIQVKADKIGSCIVSEVYKINK